MKTTVHNPLNKKPYGVRLRDVNKYPGLYRPINSVNYVNGVVLFVPPVRVFPAQMYWIYPTESYWEPAPVNGYPDHGKGDDLFELVPCGSLSVSNSE